MNDPQKMKSISFDRAAEYYDATRGFPPGVAEKVANSLKRALPDGARLLETGVGTGRISLPLMELGYQVVGVDLSTKMMLQMRKSFEEKQPAPLLIQGDATRLPLASGRFDAVLAVHLLHLIWDWREAIDEGLRVLKPGGSYLIGYDHRPGGDPQRQFRSHLEEVVRSYGYSRDRPAMENFSEVTQYLVDRGAQVQEWSAAAWTVRYTLKETIERLNQRTWSSTWWVPEEVFRECMDKTTAWAHEQFGSLDRIYQSPRKFIWRRHRWA